MSVEIATVTAADTHELRRSVLRDGTPGDQVVFDGDDEAATFHLAAIVDGEIVAVSSWMWNGHPDLPGRTAVQLRGMATAPSQRGTGIGAALVEAGIARARGEGADVVWARARVPALSFYERAGFTAVGDEYVDATTGLPHRDIVLELA